MLLTLPSKFEDAGAWSNVQTQSTTSKACPSTGQGRECLVMRNFFGNVFTLDPSVSKRSRGRF